MEYWRMMIQMFHLTKVHPSGTKVLDDAFFSAPSGSFTVILAESRAGKSTILKMLCGEEKPTSGSLLVDHKPIQGSSSSDKRKWLGEVGLILPDLGLFPDKTVEQNILFPLQIKGADLSEGRESLLGLLSSVGLKSKAHSKPSDLSSGEEQMVLALRAMVFRPRLLLADEPFQGLDEKAAGFIAGFLGQLHREGTTIVLALQQSQITPALRALPKVDWLQLKDGKLLLAEEMIG